jgi:hypothetical protein
MGGCSVTARKIIQFLHANSGFKFDLDAVLLCPFCPSSLFMTLLAVTRLFALQVLGRLAATR